MNKRQKEVLQAQLDAEKAVLKELEQQYQSTLKDIDIKVQLLQSDDMTQSQIYRLEYQKTLKKQVEATLEKLHSDEYSTIKQFLADTYTNGFVGTMYDLNGQGIPLLIPIDKNAAAKAIISDTKLNKELYESLGIDINKMKKTISNEITRGIAGGFTHDEIARNISFASNAPLSRAKTIAKTESHRIQQASTYDAQKAAKDKGADIVKQWDSTLDGKTRSTHRNLDGQIREIEEPFEMDGKKAMFPGDFGDPAEDCNCRCSSLQRARKALDADELKTLEERAAFFGLDKSENLEDFKNNYLKASANIEKPLENTAFYGKIVSKDSVVFSDSGKPYEVPLSREKKKEIITRGINEKVPVFAVDTATNKFASYVQKVEPEEGFFDVALHGRDTSSLFFDENIDAYTLSQIIRQREDYTSGTPVRLLSCNAGNTTNTGNCVAQLVANELGVIVKAPTDVLYVTYDGVISIGKRNDGKMEIFYPRK